MTRRATPGQLDLAGRVTPPERVHPALRKAGFHVHQDGDLIHYADPFRPHSRLSQRQALGLLKARMQIVLSGGYRVRYAASLMSEVRLGHYRATKEGAWHELRAATGTTKPPAGYWIIDASTGKRCWPIEGDDLAEPAG